MRPRWRGGACPSTCSPAAGDSPAAGGPPEAGAPTEAGGPHGAAGRREHGRASPLRYHVRSDPEARPGEDTMTATWQLLRTATLRAMGKLTLREDVWRLPTGQERAYPVL